MPIKDILLPLVGEPSVAAIAQLFIPSAANSTISARTASTRAIFRRRARQLAALAVPEYDLHRWTARHFHLRIKKTGRANHDPMIMTRSF